MSRGEWEQLLVLAGLVGLFLLSYNLLAGPADAGPAPAAGLVPQFVEGA